MRKNVVTRGVYGVLAIGVSLASAACSSAPGDGGVSVGQSAQNVNVLECTENLTDCVQAAQSISDLAACNEDHAACLQGAVEDTVANLPSTVSDALAGVDSCTGDLRACVQGASAPSDLVACEEDHATCLGDTLGVDLPSLPASDAAACAEDAASCVEAATSVADLTACGNALVDCAEDAASATAGSVPGVPSGVTDALDGVRACTDDLRSCVQSAQTPSALLSCQETQASCVADSLGVNLPDPSAVTDCADDAAQCVQNASSVQDVASCSEAFADCAGTAAQDIVGDLPLPDELTSAVSTVSTCADDARACIQAAQSPSDLVACQEAQVTCVTDALGVDVPSPEDVVQCATSATDCVLSAGSLSDLDGCVDSLTSCVELPTTGLPLVDCSTQFTQCLAQNPFGALQCAEQARQCQGTP